MQKSRPIIDMMSRKYGVDASNIDALTKAIQEDDSIFQDEAAKRNVSGTVQRVPKDGVRK